jgi:hypothetical protein
LVVRMCGCVDNVGIGSFLCCFLQNSSVTDDVGFRGSNCGANQRKHGRLVTHQQNFVMLCACVSRI